MNVAAKKTDLKNLTQEQLVRFVESLGQPAFRGRQILAWIYRPGIIDFTQMTDLAKEFRAILTQSAFMSRFDDCMVECSRDGAVKFAFRLDDGQIIESVLIPEEDRNTLCVSSQVGCAMGCSFCLTGAMGFCRNLTTAEIVNQVCAVRDWTLAHDKGLLTNIVFMGMGEPLANFDNLLDAIAILTEQRGLDFSNRRITVSTCGLVPQMRRLGEETDVNLAVSLHAVNDEVRSRLMPVNKRYPIAELIEVCRTYRQKRRKRIMFEYTLLQGINDSDADAVQLAELLREVPCKINLLAVNPGSGSAYQSPGEERVLCFQRILRDRGYTVFIRTSRGEDISAACGQLAGKGWNEEQAISLDKTTLQSTGTDDNRP
ncbi:23S rRNA m(2)A-2503 methyltransferase [Desulfobulbus propionicus DSM 2032]|uniref:Probable dual-specificity RNA methyltransferase RlmN n=1 Tax=Desulfobulbus propionicus (strain ATCC 33891 / DSM 2032 / VKM B-1956 / 1pr3) TaxID=577650 RepID=A0A7U4DP95_DESPD|nr:23S rRNA (adenine(2503)-C(2))-methyltransferase RlmN [Desulfobulbus propionicus]ADW17921.1 23S rRNA m(2)A-2503 methyltransferase [Desulfobulbus propionicus DSM 2032]